MPNWYFFAPRLALAYRVHTKKKVFFFSVFFRPLLLFLFCVVYKNMKILFCEKLISFVSLIHSRQVSLLCWILYNFFFYVVSVILTIIFQWQSLTLVFCVLCLCQFLFFGDTLRQCVVSGAEGKWKKGVKKLWIKFNVI